MDDKITTKDGLLYREGQIIDLPEVDVVAQNNGFMCAERMVKYLESKKEDNE